MTARQEKLIDFLRTDTTREFTQKEICDNVEGYRYTNDIRNHCVDIWADVEEINNTPCEFKNMLILGFAYKFLLLSFVIKFCNFLI